MIVDHLENHIMYDAFHPWLRSGFQFLTRFDRDQPDGRIDLHGNDFFALVQTFTPEAPETRQFEAHRNYLDVQWVFKGSERIFSEPASRLTAVSSYDPEMDITFYTEPAIPSMIVLRPGDFALFYPAEAHKPCCVADSAGLVRKVVLKIRHSPA